MYLSVPISSSRKNINSQIIFYLIYKRNPISNFQKFAFEMRITVFFQQTSLPSVLAVIYTALAISPYYLHR